MKKYFLPLVNISFLLLFSQNLFSVNSILFVRGLYRNSKKYYDHGVYPIKYFTKSNKSRPYLFSESVSTFNLPADTTSDLGQKYDLSILMRAYEQIKAQQPTNNLAVLGQCRGASLIIKFLAEKKPNNVSLAILEAPYACVEDVIAYATRPPGIGSWRIPQWSKKLCAKIAHHYIFPPVYFPHYNPKQPQPLDLIKDIPHNTSLLFVCSKEDKITSAATGIRLYEAAIKAQHPHAYLLMLDKGAHCNFLKGEDHVKYRAAVNALLRKRGFSYDQESANLGDEILKSAHQIQ